MFPDKVVIDSSVWIEIFLMGSKSKACLKYLKYPSTVYVPSLVFFEVYKKIALQRTEEDALSTVAKMSKYQMLDFTRDIALSAADISIQNKLAMADSIVLAHARVLGATLITLDNDFAGISAVQVVR